jgi:DNA mismatch endonuclease, patch repair protein
MRNPHRPRDPEVVSRLMRAVRSHNTRGEKTLRRELAKLGLRFRLQVRWLPGRPDVVFHRARLVVFVDGDFWHGRIFVEGGPRALAHSLRTSNQAWWIQKIRGNVERDFLATAALEGLGFKVVRLWERDVLDNPSKVAARVARLVKRRL